MEEELIKITVDEVLEEVKQYQGNYNPEGLCIFFSNNIGSIFDDQGIEYRRIHIEDFVDTEYHHEFIVTIPNNDKAFLIDPSYGQFVPNGKQLLIFKQWPVALLKNYENGNKMASELLEKGLCQVNEEDVKNYLASFDITKKPEDIDFSFEKLSSRRMI